jgi:hypothetical protein
MKIKILKLIWDIICMLIGCVLPVYALVLCANMTEEVIIDAGCLVSMIWILFGIDRFSRAIKSDIDDIREKFYESKEEDILK